MAKSVMTGQVMFDLPSGSDAIREVQKRAAIRAERARLKELTKRKRFKARLRTKIKIKLMDPGPPLDKQWIEPEELPGGKKIVGFTPIERWTMPPPNQPVPAEVYERNRDRSAIVEKFTDLKEVGKSVGRTVDRWISSASYMLEKVSPNLMRQIREHARRLTMRAEMHMEIISPFYKGVRKMKRADKRDLDLALKNGDITKTEEIIKKYNLEAEYAAVREVDDALYEGAKEVGIDITYRLHHWHRRVKNGDGLLKELIVRYGRSNIMPVYEAALERKKKQVGGRELKDDEKAQVINSMIRGFGRRIWLARPGASKERSLWLIDEGIDKFYYPALDSMVINIREMNKSITDREFFGKQTRRIQKLRTERGALATRLYKLSTRTGTRRPMEEGKHTTHISTAAKRLEDVEAELTELNGIDLGSTIGGYTLDMVLNNQITPEQESKVERALRAYFNYRATGKATRALKSIAYGTTLGSFFQTLTQVKDYGRIIYRSPSRGLIETMKMLIPGVEQEYSMKDLWMKDIAADISGMSRILDAELTATGFKMVDKEMKELYINTVLSKYRIQSKKGRHLKKGSTFRERIERHLGEDIEQGIRDLRSGRKTELTDKLAWGELLDMHPVALSEMTVAYLEGRGGTRLLYTLRTFGLKQFEYARREIFKDMKKKPTRAVARLIWLAFSLGLAGAGVETLKDIIRGRKPDIPGEVIDEWLQLLFMSRFTAAMAKQEGPGAALWRNFSPPMRVIDAPARDIITGKFRETPRIIPIVGEPYYWWFGRGAEKIRGANKPGPFE